MKDNIKILIASKLDPIVCKILKESGLEPVVMENIPNGIESVIKDYQGLIVRGEKVDKTAIEAGKNLKLVVRAGSGVNTIDLESASKRNVLVMNTPDANSNSVAELIFGYMLISARSLIKADITTKQGKWLKKEFMGTELAEKTIGIIGVGNIGSRVARKAKAFDMNVICYDPILSSERARILGVKIVSLEDLFKNSDFITLHVPLTPITNEMIKYETLKLVKDNATIINASRAELIEKGALEKILKEKPGVKVAADLFYEGDKEGEKSLAVFGDQIIMTPHIGASTKDANYRTAKLSAEQTVNFFNSGIIKNSVNIIEVPPDLNTMYMNLAMKIGKIAYFMVKDFGQPYEIKITCYGNLYKYTYILIKSGIMGVLDSFLEEKVTPIMVEKIAHENGILITPREPDNFKGHGDSITLDIVAKDKDKYNETSIRGTISPENKIIIRRIDNFDNVDIIPLGNISVFTYDDRKGISGQIGDIYSENDINILDGRYKTSNDGRFAIAVLNTSRLVEENIISNVKEKIRARKAFSVYF